MSDVIPVRGEFGIVLAKDDGIVNVGCTATVDRVFRRYPDGRLELLAIGQRRFQVVSLDEEKSYLRAAVEYFLMMRKHQRFPPRYARKPLRLTNAYVK